MFSRRSSKDLTQDKKLKQRPESAGDSSKVQAQEDKKHGRSRSNSIKSIFGFGSTSKPSTPAETIHPNTLSNPNLNLDEKDVLKHLSPLCKAVYQQDLAKFKDLLAKKKTDLTTVDKSTQRNVFHWIASQPNAEFINCLYDVKTNMDIQVLVNSGDIDAKTPLILAVLNRNVDVLRALLNESVYSINAADKNGRNPLQYAILGDDIACSTILILRGASVDTLNQQGLPLLLEAISTGHEESANALIDNNANLTLKDSKKRTALHYSVKAKSLKTLKRLLKKDANVHEKDIEGKTALDLAKETLEEMKRVNFNKDDILTMESIAEELRENSLKPKQKQANRMKDSELSINNLAVSPTDIVIIQEDRVLDFGEESDEDPLRRSNSSQIAGSTSGIFEKNPLVGSLNSDVTSKNELSSSVMVDSVRDDRRNTQTMPRLSTQQAPNSGSSLKIPGQMGKSRSLHDMKVDEKSEMTIINPLSRRQSVILGSLEELKQKSAQNNIEHVEILEGVASGLVKRKSIASEAELFGSRDTNNDDLNSASSINSKNEYLKFKRETLLQIFQKLDAQIGLTIEKEDDFIQFVSRLVEKAVNFHSELIEKQNIVEDNRKLIKEIEKIKKDHDELQSAFKKEKAAFEVELAQKDQYISEIEGKVEILEAHLDQQLETGKNLAPPQFVPNGEEIAELQSKISSLTQQMRDKDLQLLDLETDLEDEKERLEMIIEDHNKTLRQCNDLRQKLESKSSDPDTRSPHSELELTNLKKQLRFKDEENTRLKKEIFQLETEIEEKDQVRSRPTTANVDAIREKVEEKEKSYHNGNKPRPLSDGDNYSDEMNNLRRSLSVIGEEPFSSKEQLYSELSSELTANQQRLIMEIASRKSKEEQFESLTLQLEETKEKLNASMKQLEGLQNANAGYQKAAKEQHYQIVKMSDDLGEKEISLDNERRLSQQLKDRIRVLEETLNATQKEIRSFSIRTGDTNRNSIQSEELSAALAQLNETRLLLKSKVEEIEVLKTTRDTDGFINLLQDKLCKEQEIRVKYESEISSMRMILNDIGMNMNEIQLLYDVNTKEKHADVIQRETLDQLLVKSDDISVRTREKVDEMFRTVSHLRSQLKELETQVQAKDQELQIHMDSSSKAEKLQLKLAEEYNNLREKHLLSEKSSLETRAKDREEIKSLQKSLQDKDYEKSIMEAQASKAISEHENNASALQSQIQKLKQEKEDLSKLLTKDREKAMRDLSEMHYQMEDKNQKISDLEDKLKNIQIQKQELQVKLEAALHDVTSLKDAIAEKVTTVDILQATVSEQDGFKPDLEKAKEGIQKLQLKISKLNNELNEKRKESETFLKAQANWESEKEVLLAETMKLQAKISDDSKSKQALEESLNSICSKLEDLAHKNTEPLNNLRRTETESSYSRGSMTDYINAIDEMWTKNDEVFHFLKAQQDLWSSWIFQLNHDSPVSTAVKKCIMVLGGNLESYLSRKISNHLVILNKNMTRILMEMKVEAKHIETNHEIRDIEAQNRYKEQILQLSHAKQNLEEKFADIKETLEKSQNFAAELERTYKSELRSMQAAIEEYKKTISEKEQRIQELGNKLISQEKFGEQNDSLRKQISSLEQQIRQNLQELNLSQMDILYLKQELEDRDPDFVAEWDRAKQEQDEVVNLKLQKNQSSHIQASINSEGLDNALENVVPRKLMMGVSPSNRFRSSSVISRTNGEKVNILKNVTAQMSALEKEYRQAQESWESAKKQMEDHHSKEKSELMDELKLHQTSLDKLEKSLHQIAVDARNRTKGGAVQLLDSLIDRLDDLQDEREQLEGMRQKNERKLIENYETQIQNLLHDIEIIRLQFETAVKRNIVIERQLSGQSNMSARLPINTSRTQQLREQLAEMRVLIKRT